MRENRTHGSEGGVTQTNALSLPLSAGPAMGSRDFVQVWGMGGRCLAASRSLVTWDS